MRLPQVRILKRVCKMISWHTNRVPDLNEEKYRAAWNRLLFKACDNCAACMMNGQLIGVDSLTHTSVLWGLISPVVKNAFARQLRHEVGI